MKKLTKILFHVFLLLCIVVSAAMLTACQGAPGKDGINGVDGQNGADGKDGVTPHIGDDGYWYFGDTKTEFKAEGLDGTDGVDGVDGKSAYDLYKEKYPDYEGSLDEWLASLKGEDGVDGTDGVDGVDGKSAYDLYKEQHPDYEGSLDEWLASLKGAAGKNGSSGKNGKDGVDGKSAYDLYKEQYPDYEGSLDDWLASLKGEDGTNGTNGKDGVTPHIGDDGYWYFGETKTDFKATGSNGKSAYDLYVEEFKSQGENAGKEPLSLEAWLKSLQKGTVWQVGEGAPLSLDLTVDDGTFYLDTKSGQIWRASVTDDEVTWEPIYNTSGKEIEEIKEDRHSHFMDEGATDENVHRLGVWIKFKDGTSKFIQLSCEHELDPLTSIYIIQGDCEKGEVKFTRCKWCKQWLVQIDAQIYASIPHKYDTNWSFDENQHWHAPICAHKNDLENKDVNNHNWRTYYTVDYDEEKDSSKGYIKWQQCSVCGYITNSKFSDPSSLVQEDGKVHISDAEEWNMFARAVNSGATYDEGKKFSEAEVVLDKDIDFGGSTIIPVGIPTNVDALVDRSNGSYLDLVSEASIEGGFRGKFDGQGKSLSGFVIDSVHFTGVFGYVNNATITNLIIKNASIYGEAFVGGAVGFIEGVDVRISKVSVIDCTVYGLAHVGGIAGYALNAGPQLKRANTADEAAIKNCTVMGTGFSDEDETYPKMKIIASLGPKDTVDGKFYDSVNAGGILGTSHSSSVNSCYLHIANVYARGTRAFIVGLADGTEEAHSVVVGNITGKYKFTFDPSCEYVSCTCYSAPFDKEGVEVIDTIKDSDVAMTDEHGDDYVRFLENKYISKDNSNTSGEKPYSD